MSINDPFRDHIRGLESPATRHYQITPSDTLDIVPRPRVIHCTAPGTVAVRDEEGVVLSYALLAGEILQFSAMRVMATGTTATVIGWL